MYSTTKSKILSKSDFKIAKAAFKAVDKKKWQTAIKLSKKSKDKICRASGAKWNRTRCDGY